MARNDVYLYTNATSPAGAVVTAQQTLTAATFPDLVIGDAPLFNFYFTDGTASWPAFAGSGSYSITWALSESVAGDEPPLALQTQATAITGGWSMRLPLNTGALINQAKAFRVSQDYPVVRLWQHIRVSDSDGYAVSYALIRTNVRLRTIPDTQVVPDSPLPSGTQALLVTAGGVLVSPTNFFSANALSSRSEQSNSTGDTTASFGTYSILHTEVLNVTGSAGTRNLALPVAGRFTGNACRVRLNLPATSGITVNVRNDTAAGTVLFTIATDGSGDDAALDLTFNGTAWERFNATYPAI